MKLKKDDLIQLYKNMVLGRKMDLKAIESLAAGKIMSFFHSGQGSEGLAAGVATFLNKDDYLWYHHRGHGETYLVSKGCSVYEWFCEHYGRIDGSVKGIGAGLHAYDPEHGVLGVSGLIGDQFTTTLGIGLGCKKNGRSQVMVACFGDGSSNRGTLHEAFNLSSLWKLPIIWVCDNNGVAQFTPIKSAYPKDDIADLAAGYDMPGVVVDGMDVLAVVEAVNAAVERARSGEGPSMIEAKTMRYRAHSEGSPNVFHYEERPQELIDEWKKRDPIDSFTKKLISQKVLTKKDIEMIDKELQEQVDQAHQSALDCEKTTLSVLDITMYAE